MRFRLPPEQRNAKGAIRRVGFEIEFSGIHLETAARLLAEQFEGRAEAHGRFSWSVTGTRFGEFAIELDWNLLKQGNYREYAAKAGIDLDKLNMRGPVDDLLAALAPTVVPFEVVTPPLPVTGLAAIGELGEALRGAGAVGTSSSLLFAFGLHINPEAPSLDAAAVLAVLRAYLLLQPWLVEQSSINLARRVAGYIRLFPDDYRNLVLDPAYAPDFGQFVRDYLRFNATRNRPLDLLPLLACRDRNRVAAAMKESHLLKARPAYHYRLPNCEVDDPGWSAAAEWNRWVRVEELAADPGRLRVMSECFLELPEGPPRGRDGAWLETLDQWLPERDHPAP